MIRNKQYTLKQLARDYQIKQSTLYSRYRAGKRGKELIRPPQAVLRPKKPSVIRKADMSKVTYFAKPWDFRSLGQAYGLASSTVRSRYYRGDRNDDLVRPLGQKVRLSRQPRHVQIKGKQYTFRELSEYYRLPITLLYDRYYQGERDQELVRPMFTRSDLYGFIL